jgi:hypothetical protein
MKGFFKLKMDVKILLEGYDSIMKCKGIIDKYQLPVTELKPETLLNSVYKHLFSLQDYELSVSSYLKK